MVLAKDMSGVVVKVTPLSQKVFVRSTASLHVRERLASIIPSPYALMWELPTLSLSF